jgi:uncharacterized protein YbjT (DUF2867 family)
MSAKDLVLVAGATGGVGQIAVGKLLEKDFAVRVLTRDRDKAEKMFGNKVEIAIGDTLNPPTLIAAMPDIVYIVCCTGTTAFPSAKWNFQSLFSASNTPQKVDAEGVKNLVAAAPPNLKRFIFISSCGVLRKDKFPFKILNAFGVLDAKKQGEEAIVASGLPYTIIRPGRLIDGPYTSYDLNTLLKAKTDGKLGLVIGTGDTLTGDTSRIDLAAACVESISHPITENKIFELINKGERPPTIGWARLFASLA